MASVTAAAEPSPSKVPARAYWSTFLRSFAIQGSWNYRTMIGQGFAFALLPILQHLHAEDRDQLVRAVERHSDYFNAHPYLAELALGAVARMETDGTDPEIISRFKTAIRGPLGGIGDRLIWVGLLPTSLLTALIAVAAGSPYWLPPVLFLVVYNLGHLTLRVWAYRTGLTEGARVVERLRKASLPRVADQLCAVGVLFAGVFTALVAVRAVGLEATPIDAVVVLIAGGTMATGIRLGNESWNLAAAITVALTIAVLVVGTFS